MIKIVQRLNKEPNLALQEMLGNEYGFPQKGHLVYNLEECNIFFAALLEAMRIEGYDVDLITRIREALDELEEQEDD
jgi:hypothetical protein